MLVAHLSPSKIFLAIYGINFMNIRRGSKVKGQSTDINKKKRLKLRFVNSKIVAPKTTIKLIKNVNIKWEVETKLY